MVSVKKLDVCIAIVGKSGMGALEYYPENIFLQKEEQMSLDEIAKECERIFETNNSESLDISNGRFIRWCKTQGIL